MESDQTRIVWVTMMALADQHGRVLASVPGLAHTARVPIEAVRAALEIFLSPDPDSRTPDFEGRRIEKVEGGWRLLNYARHRETGKPVRASLDMAGYVYYAGEPTGDRVKIGFSKNPWARINDLRVTNPGLEILATESATMQTEKDRHHEFASARLEGEWFKFTPSLKSLIANLMDRDSRKEKRSNYGSKKSVTTVATVAAEAEAEAEVKIKTSCSERHDRSELENIKGTLPLNDGTDFPITESQVSEWIALYPAVDVMQQLRNMKGWISAHQSRRKTRKGILKFIHSWLSRSQDAGRVPNVLNQPNRFPTKTERNIEAARQAISDLCDHAPDGISGGTSSNSESGDFKAVHPAPVVLPPERSQSDSATNQPRATR